MSKPTLDTEIAKVEREMIELEHRVAINVVMRIDETLTLLKGVLTDLKAIKGDLKFNLTITKDSNTTVVAKLNGKTITAGTKVISAGDELVFTITYATNYIKDTLTVNGEPYVSGTVINVVDDITLVATAKLPTYNLTKTVDSNTTITVTKDGTPITAGANAITYGEVLTITASYSTGYEKNVLTVNGNNFTSGNTITVNGNIDIVGNAKPIAYDLSISADENTTITVLKGDVPVSAGENTITYGDVLTISASYSEGYEKDTLTVNGEAFTSGNTITVSGNVAVVSTSKATPQEETPE